MGHDLITNQQKERILELAIKALDDDLSPSESKELVGYISSSKALAAYYSTCIKMHLSMIELETSYRLSQEGNPALDREFWQLLAIHEQTSPPIEIPKDKSGQELIPKVVFDKTPRKISKFTLFTGILSTAAILFFVLFLRFAPMTPYSIEVATLIDQMNAKWADSNVSFENGNRLWTNQMPLCLDKGIVKLQYDEGVDVLLEGPAKFTIERSGIYFEYGRLFSRVSASGLGFSIETPTTQFVDLGTEFGVQADVNGSAEMHVIKGKVQWFAGSKGNPKSSRIVTENEAVRYDANTGNIETVPIRTEAFVRSINSKTKQIWHGESSLSVASIVAGGTGFEEIPLLVGINPATGAFTASIVRDNRASKQLYNPVPDSPFIDGVFVPDGQNGPIPVTSAGNTFDCPNTAGLFSHEIAVYRGDIESWHTTIPAAVLNGKKYDNNSIVMIHSNSGITFDLQAIRESLPDLTLKGFIAWGGLTEAISDLEKDRPDIDFWILVDGQVKYERKLLKIEDGLVDFNIDLNPQDRFLTLIVTDGLRPDDGKREFPYGNDFFYLIDPQLSLTERLER